jgi:5-methylcytosine-specific restriction protein A
VPRPKHSGVCATAGCPTDTIAGESHCAAHTRPPWHGSTSRADGLTSSAWRKTTMRILARDRGICHVCGEPGASECDHIVPRSEGGTNDDSNLAAIHKRPCHQTKSNREAARGRARARADH